MKRMRKVFMALVCVCMLAILAIPGRVSASDVGNEAVKEASKGVVQVIVTYIDNNNTEWIIQSGSGFFIGSEAGPDTIVTNHHVIALDSETRDVASEVFGRDIINDINIKIVVDRDLTKTASLTELNSADYDIAVLKLDEPLAEMNILTLSTAEPTKTQSVYALGFPDVPQVIKDKQFFTTDDVTITSGKISDITEIGQTYHIQHECKLSSGNSGGPLVNENGEVVGVNRADANGEYYYSVKISELTKLLDKMNMAYNTGSSTQSTGSTDGISSVDTSALSSAISTAKGKDESAYTEDSYSFLKAALEAGQTALSDAEAVNAKEDRTEEEVASAQDSVDRAAADINDAIGKLEEKSGLPIGLIIGIVAAVIVVIIIIVIVAGKGKKKSKTAAGPAPTPATPVPPTAGPAPVMGGSPIPPTPVQPKPFPGGFDMAGSDETSVLNEGAGQTTVLSASAKAVPTATLRRATNGETAIINKARYILGKEKSKVDFCISNNSSISRVHAEITYEGDSFYITDQNATNFTFVNGNKVNPGQKVRISNGDKIKLSDEEFEFKA